MRTARTLAFVALAACVGCDQPRQPASLVVLTHPDDELAIVDYLLLQGPAARLLYLTRGETLDAPQGRADEARAAAALYGSASVELAPAPLGRLTLDPAVPWTSWDVAALVERLAREIDRVRPAEIVTWMPNVASVHGEHQLTGAIVTAACLAARHPPRRILYAFESFKVGYYRMRPEVLDPEELGMTVEQVRAPSLPIERLATLYPSQGIDRWLAIERDAYLDGTHLAVFPTPEAAVPLGPPRPEAPLSTAEAARVLPHFGAWLEEIGLEPLARVVALVPAGHRVDGETPSPLVTAFHAHELRRELHDGVLYVLLPRDVIGLFVDGRRFLDETAGATSKPSDL